jgi:outer membrane lipoprotein-sorting protein
MNKSLVEKRRNPKACLCVLLLLGCRCAAPAADLEPAIRSWLVAQTNFQTWSADFVQTRTFKSLTQPLVASGRVWFQAPERFRWELGHPPRTIAVRATEEMLVIYPLLKRVERYPLKGGQMGQWRDALALLQAGFPRSEIELERQYKIVSQKVLEDVGHLVLEPKSANAREMIPQITIEFDLKALKLRSTELHFKDGSSMRNDFKDPVLNPALEPGLFSPPLPSDYEVVEPLKKG